MSNIDVLRTWRWVPSPQSTISVASGRRNAMQDTLRETVGQPEEVPSHETAMPVAAAAGSSGKPEKLSRLALLLLGRGRGDGWTVPCHCAAGDALDTSALGRLMLG